MTIQLRNRLLMLSTVMVVGMATCGVLLAGKGGNGKPPKDPPLPPVRYQIQFLDMPNSSIGVWGNLGFNDSGQVVGGFGADFDGDGARDAVRAFLSDPEVPGNQAIDLNEIVSGIPAGWSIRKANAINTPGDIAAVLEPTATPGLFLQAAMIDMSTTPPQLHIVPDASFTDYSAATDINDLGDIAVKYRRNDGTWGNYVYNFGLYAELLETTSPIDMGVDASERWPRINNAGQITGSYNDSGTTHPYRYTLGSGIERFPELTGASSGITDVGEFGGTERVQIRKNRYNEIAYIMGSQLELLEDLQALVVRDLNNSHDLITWDGTDTLYHRSWGILDPPALFDPSDPDTAFWADNVTWYTFDRLSDRDGATDFPRLFGRVQTGGGDLAFILTPVLAP